MKRLALAPHRLYFFLGAVAILFLFGWWWLSLQIPNLPPAIALHALLMPLGIFPLFILGFTFTAGPRWLSVDAAPRFFLPTGTCYFFGILLVVIGSVIGSAAAAQLSTIGLALMWLAWGSATWRWAGLVLKSSVADKRHPLVLLAAMGGGLLALSAALAWSAGITGAWVLARQLAFFCFLLPVFLTVCHRMLPFFSASVIKPYTAWRPFWLLWIWLAGCSVLTLAGTLGMDMVEAVSATLLSMSFAFTSWRWGLLASFKNRLLAMLHLSFAWLTIFFALYAASAFGAPLGSAAFHALGLGFMATMLVAFVTRVSYGHSGRKLEASTTLWVLYLSLHAAALLRVAASVFQLPALMPVSATVWLVLFGCWGAMMLPIYLKARQDGQPG